MRKLIAVLTAVFLLVVAAEHNSPVIVTQHGKSKLANLKPVKDVILPGMGNNKTVVTDTTALKQSNWYSTAMQAIATQEYNINYQESCKAFASPNRNNNLRSTYTADKFTLTPRNDSAGKWKLELALQGIYTGKQKIMAPDDNAIISRSANTIRFDNGAFVTEYINSREGVRQNFIIPQEPATTPKNLTVKLQTNSGWLTNKVNDKELHFAKATKNGYDKKITYNGLKAWDANQKELTAYFSVSGSVINIHVQTAGAVYPVTIDPISTTAAAMVESNQATAFLGFSVASAGDVNGDGYSDVIVGAYMYDNGQTNEGAAFIYHGSATGISTTAAVMLESNQVSAYMGYAVSTAGDVNGDGYSDVIVGAYYYDNGNTDEGVAFIYHGSSTGIGTTAAAMVEGNQNSSRFGCAVACAGDVNGDSYSDVIVGAFGFGNGQTDEGVAFVYHGSATGINTTFAARVESDVALAYFGWSVSSAGDVNGDGYSDVIVGAQNYANGEAAEGAAYIYHGSATGISTTPALLIQSNQANAFMGYSVGGAGDVNGDGYSDVIVGVPNYDNGQTDEGVAFIYLGSAAGVSAVAATTLECNQANALMGYSAASAGDVNGDGYSDVIVGAVLYDNGETDEGVAFVYCGSSTGINTTAIAILECNQASAGMGRSAACAGDVNGDGYSDVIVGAYQYDNGQSNEGAAFIFNGVPAGVSTTAVAIGEANQASALMGQSVASAGDVNGDGYSDVIVGVSYYDNGQTDEGVAFIYHGTATGINTVAAAMVESNKANAQLGASVACAGDVNGDGYSDIIAGAPYYNNGLTNAGAAYIYHGSATGINTVVATLIESTQAFMLMGLSVAGAGDVNADGYSDIIVGVLGYTNGQSNEGGAFIYHGSATGVGTVANAIVESNQASANFGSSVATAGDVNGDGYSDVIVGANLYDNGQTNEGAAFVYHGSATGINTTAAAMLEANQASAAFGCSVATAGDVNGDGFSDVIVGALLYDNGQSDEGAAFVYRGTAAGVNTTPAAMLESNQADAQFGLSVASAGDVNGDGYSDVIVGAYYYDNGQANEGAAFVYQGSNTGISTTAAAMLECNQAGANMGYSVACAGDVNGDGFSDVIAGASHYTNGQSSEGAFFVYLGNGGAGKRSNLRLYNTDLTTPIQASNKLNPNLFGAGLFAKSSLGRVNAKLVWEIKRQGQPFSGNPITNSTAFYDKVSFFSNTGINGIELKSQVQKLSLQNKIRCRIEYSKATAFTGQVYGPWRYPAGYTMGAFGIGAVALPVSLTAFNAQYINADDVLLSWASTNELDLQQYIVQKSTDGIHFTDIATVPAKAINGGAQYNTTDKNVTAPVTYYRLQLVDNAGKTTYSKTITVKSNHTITATIAPNPVNKGSNAHLLITAVKDKLPVQLQLFSSTGQQILIQNTVLQKGLNNMLLAVSTLPAGVYVVHITGEGMDATCSMIINGSVR
ncbi:FG-GAP-like repeat-containing protein [Ferruginibacter sp.]